MTILLPGITDIAAMAEKTFIAVDEVRNLGSLSRKEPEARSQKPE